MALIAEMKHILTEKEPYRPTRKDLDEWFTKINTEVFGGVLKRFHQIKFVEMRYCWGITNGLQLWSKHSKVRRLLLHTDLVIRKTYPTKQRFIEVLAHEMVHHYQWTHGDSYDIHGKTFWEWKKPLKKFKIELQDSYGPYLSVSGDYGRKTLATF